jgi:YARHG domain
MRMSTIVSASLIVSTAVVMSAGAARAQSCEDLWYERNSIYKDAGYCFKTRRAISTFGNADCQYDSESQLPLSPGQRRRIASIVRMERELGCR